MSLILYMREKKGTLGLLFLVLCCLHVIPAVPGQFVFRTGQQRGAPFLYSVIFAGVVFTVCAAVFAAACIILWRRLNLKRKIGGVLFLNIIACYLLVQSLASVFMGVAGTAVHSVLGDGASRIFLLVLSRIWSGIWHAVFLSALINAYRGRRGRRLRDGVTSFALKMWHVITGYIILTSLLICLPVSDGQWLAMAVAEIVYVEMLVVCMGAYSGAKNEKEAVKSREKGR